MRSELQIPAVSIAGTRRRAQRLDGRTHYRLPHHRFRPRAVRRLWVEWFLQSTTHLLLESLLPLTGEPALARLEVDLGLLQDRGLTVGAVLHGSDIRDPDRHAAEVPNSFCRLGDETWRQSLATAARRRRDCVQSMGLPAFVSTPDLMLDLPSSVWLPLVVDPSLWRADRAPFSRRRPVFLHLPSRRKPAIKGTDIIDPVLRNLDRRGIIEYRSPESVPHRRVPGLVRDADVVVEQMLAASYGVAAVEAMAAGRLVLGNVGTRTRSLMDDDPPIVDVSPETLEEVVVQIATSPHLFVEAAALGPPFVDRVHSGPRSAHVLLPFLGQVGPDAEL